MFLVRRVIHVYTSLYFTRRHKYTMMEFLKNMNITWYDWRHASNGFFFLSFPFGGKCLPFTTPWGEFFVVKRYVEENS